MHQPAQEMLLHSQCVENAWNMEWLLTQLLDLLSDKLLQLQHHLAHLHLLRYKCCYQLILQHLSLIHIWKSSFKVYAAGYQLRETLHHR